MCEGVVHKVAVCDDGSGDIRYDFLEIIPPCVEDNPFCRECDVIGIWTIDFANNSTLRWKQSR